MVCIWNMETGESKILGIIDPELIDGCVPPVAISSVAISPDDRFVATGSSDKVVRIWDMANGALVERLKGHKDLVYLVAFSPDGRGLVSGSWDRSLKYWDLTELGRIVPRPGMGTVQPLQQSERVANNSMDVPPDMKHGVGDRGSPCTVVFNVEHQVKSVAVSPDGAWLVTGFISGGVQFWSLKDAQTQFMLWGHGMGMNLIDLSPAGGLLATSDFNRRVRVWSYTAI